MSHFISDTIPLQHKPLVNFQQRTFIRPDLKKLVKTKTLPDEIQPHQQIIDHLCSKLSGRESIRLERQNQDLFINYKKKLKHKRNSSMLGSLVIEQIFTRDEDLTEQQRLKRRNKSHINMMKYLQNMPSKVYLHQRYNNTINQKINVLQETKQIQQRKQNYRNWYNENNNSPMKNPNFTKMTFLLQKISSQSRLLNKVDENKINSGQNRVSFQKQRLSNNKIIDKSPKAPKICVPNVTLQPIGINKYQPKHHSKWMQGNDLLQTQK